MQGSIIASCGCKLVDGEETVQVRIGHETCDAVDGFYPCVGYHAYCPRCAEKAKAWDTYLPDDVPDEWWFNEGYPAQRKRMSASQ